MKNQIVLTDDEPMLRELTGAYLEALFPEHEIRTGNDGLDLIALSTERDVAPDLIVCDNNNNRYHGVEGARDARIIGIRAPIIVISGLLQDARDEAGRYGLGGDEGIVYLQKPFTMNTLREAIATAQKQVYGPTFIEPDETKQAA